MKTVIVLVVVGVIAFFSIRSVIKSFKGEGGCSCSDSCPGKKDPDSSCCSDKKTKK